MAIVPADSKACGLLAEHFLDDASAHRLGGSLRLDDDHVSRLCAHSFLTSHHGSSTTLLCDHATRGRFAVATEDLTRVLDEAEVSYELLPHERTESALAEAEVLGIAPADVAKTLVVRIPDGYLRAVLPASARIDLRKLREARGGGGKKKIHLASEEDLARDYGEFELGAVPPIGGSRRDPVVIDRRLAER
ncbi:MAG: aminoacyl-tRNA deacylase, partial [Gaiellaceae bacterium]